jgi:regulator of sirC expression with transglutaminase-like and TPR domain
MSDELSLTLFAHLCADPERNFAEAALMIAEIEHRALDTSRYLAALDDLGEGIRRAVGAPREGADEANELLLEPAARWLFGPAGFHGNESDYYDPRNSFLNEVLDRRTGIPISLAVLLMESCRRAGIAASGISFPGHFLVGSGPRGALIIDPFTGRALNREEIHALHAKATGDKREPPARLFTPASKAQILVRMLANLRGIYASRKDAEHLLAVLLRMELLAPSEELAREIESLGGRRGRPWKTSSRGVAGGN